MKSAPDLGNALRLLRNPRKCAAPVAASRKRCDCHKICTWPCESDAPASNALAGEPRSLRPGVAIRLTFEHPKALTKPGEGLLLTLFTFLFPRHTRARFFPACLFLLLESTEDLPATQDAVPQINSCLPTCSVRSLPLATNLREAAQNALVKRLSDAEMIVASGHPPVERYQGVLMQFTENTFSTHPHHASHEPPK